MYFCSVAVLAQPRRDKTTISFAFPKCFAKKMIKQLTLKDESFAGILWAFCGHLTLLTLLTTLLTLLTLLTTLLTLLTLVHWAPSSLLHD